MKVKDKVVIVTGASMGIGEVTAKLLSKQGAKVVLAARSLDKLKNLEKELNGSYAIKVDMTDEKEIKNMVKKTVEHFGRVDILINNAGQGYDAFTTDIKIDKFKYLFDLNLLGPVIAMQEVIPYMKKQGEGSIINVASGTALMFIPGMGAYSSLKRSLVGVSLTAREELEKYNITVSVIYPYITSTNFEKNTIKNGVMQDEGDSPPMPGDPPEYIAQKILDLINSKEAESFAHDWMGKR